MKDKARQFALKKHSEQKYSKEFPYIVHLDAVHQIAVEFGLSETIQTAAFLHDTLEDTQTTPEELTVLFGPEVSLLVQFVTDEPGETRKEKHIKTYPKIRRSSEAVALKLCDRLSHVRFRATGGKLIKMYQKEHGEFKEALFKPGEFDLLWAEIEKGLKHQ